MKRTTTYIVAVRYENGDRCYADPYGRTEYTTVKLRYAKRKDAIAFFEAAKTSGFYQKHQIHSMRVWSETVTDDIAAWSWMDRLPPKEKKK